MSQENLEVVERVLAALNGRDVEGYLACCAEDVQLCTPMFGGVYDGPAGIRRFFTDVADAAPDFHVTVIVWSRLALIVPWRSCRSTAAGESAALRLPTTRRTCTTS